MARKPDIPCARCGKLLYSSPTSLPAGQRMCHPCRREDPQRDPRRCVLPGCDVIYTPTHKAQRFCSVPCANKSGRGISTGSRTARPCEICGQQFKPSGGAYKPGRVQRTCSRACGVELRRRKGTLSRPYALGSTGPASRVYIRECAWCGKLFVGRAAKTWTCSRECSRRQGWVNDARRVHKRERRCQCGQQIPLKRQRCDDCRDASDRDARRRARRVRRARQRGVITEPYTLTEIAARDRYRCGFCRKQVAMTKVVPHPKAPTIDHIIPLADGGDDTRANVQLAHFLCNSLAGTTGTKQAALFG